MGLSSFYHQTKLASKNPDNGKLKGESLQQYLQEKWKMLMSWSVHGILLYVTVISIAKANKILGAVGTTVHFWQYSIWLQLTFIDSFSEINTIQNSESSCDTTFIRWWNLGSQQVTTLVIHNHLFFVPINSNPSY